LLAAVKGHDALRPEEGEQLSLELVVLGALGLLYVRGIPTQAMVVAAQGAMRVLAVKAVNLRAVVLDIQQEIMALVVVEVGEQVIAVLLLLVEGTVAAGLEYWGKVLMALVVIVLLH
jgi:hypothetical protein